MAKKTSKNLQRVQDMLDGNFQTKTQIWMGEEKESERKVGDKWTDSDGVQWEQKQGYRSKISKTPDTGMFSKAIPTPEFV